MATMSTHPEYGMIFQLKNMSVLTFDSSNKLASAYAYLNVIRMFIILHMLEVN